MDTPYGRTVYFTAEALEVQYIYTLFYSLIVRFAFVHFTRHTTLDIYHYDPRLVPVIVEGICSYYKIANQQTSFPISTHPHA
jgi:hypothetical protein